MPHVSLKHGLAALIVSLALIGCSDPKNQMFDPETGKHITGWLPAQHATYASSGTTTMGNAIPSTAACTGCHGADLSGGISDVSCSSCHLGGPTAIHPATWLPIVLMHGPSVSTGATGSGATTPAQCANQYCHGASLNGVAQSGPACSACHTWPWDGVVACGACHAIPPAGTRYPNMAGRHAVHTAITGTALAGCSVCHNGSDGALGTIIHYNNVINVAFLLAYNAKTGAASYNAAAHTCSNVSCHGGQQTPNWTSGSIDVNSQCTSCHAYGTSSQNPQYNSFWSGEHDKHVNGERFACTECHDTAKLSAVHFNDLNTITMGQAYLTIRNTLFYTGSAGATGNCTINCHGENHNNRGWQ